MHKSRLLCVCVLGIGSLLFASVPYRELMAGYGMSDEDIEFAMQYMDDAGIGQSGHAEPEPLEYQPFVDEYQIPDFDEGTEDLLLLQAKKVYAELTGRLTARETGALRSLFPHSPTFDGRSMPGFSLQDTSLMTSTLLGSAVDAHLTAALCTAAFSFWPDESAIISNYAVSLASLVQRGHSLPLGEEEIITIASYAVNRSLDHGRWSGASVRRLLNVGQLLSGFGRYDEALAVLEKAYSLDASDSEVCVALASIYQKLGQTQKAKNLLAKRQFLPSATMQQSKAVKEDAEIVADYLGLGASVPVEAMEPAFAALESQEIVTAADFLKDLVPQEAEKVRRFVSSLVHEQTYKLPNPVLLTQYATVQAVNAPLGSSALVEFTQALAIYAVRSVAATAAYQAKMFENLGVDFRLKVDPMKMLANPQAYEHYTEDMVIEYDDAALDEKIAEIEEAAMDFESLIAQGNVGAVMRTLSTIDPSYGLFDLRPHDYADAQNIVFQQQNFLAMQQVYQFYTSYIGRLTLETLKVVQDSLHAYDESYKALSMKENADLQKAEGIEDDDQRALAVHKVHTTYIPQYNGIANRYFMQASNASVPAYKKLERMVQPMYQKVFSHILLISDPQVREEKELMLRSFILTYVTLALENILSSYAGYEYKDPWDCGCDFASLRQAADREQNERDKLEKEREAREREGKRQFDSKEIPPTSPLYKKLDAYGTDLSIPFIPTLKGRISCARTEAVFTADFSPVGGPNLDYTFSQSANSGATNHGGGLSMELADGRASLSLRTSVSTDGKGVVTDYQFKGNLDVSASAGPASAGAGAELSYGSQSGWHSDVQANASLSAQTFAGSAKAGYTTSVNAGSNLTASFERNLNPMQSLSESALNQLSDIDDAPKPIWSGRFTE